MVGTTLIVGIGSVIAIARPAAHARCGSASSARFAIAAAVVAVLTALVISGRGTYVQSLLRPAGTGGSARRSPTDASRVSSPRSSGRCSISSAGTRRGWPCCSTATIAVVRADGARGVGDPARERHAGRRRSARWRWRRSRGSRASRRPSFPRTSARSKRRASRRSRRSAQSAAAPRWRWRAGSADCSGPASAWRSTRAARSVVRDSGIRHAADAAGIRRARCCSTSCVIRACPRLAARAARRAAAERAHPPRRPSAPATRGSSSGPGAAARAREDRALRADGRAVRRRVTLVARYRRMARRAGSTLLPGHDRHGRRRRDARLAGAARRARRTHAAGRRRCATSPAGASWPVSGVLRVAAARRGTIRRRSPARSAQPPRPADARPSGDDVSHGRATPGDPHACDAADVAARRSRLSGDRATRTPTPRSRASTAASRCRSASR